MSILQTCTKINDLEKKINDNLSDLRGMVEMLKTAKFEKSKSLKEKYETILAETIEMTDEREYYLNQINEIDCYFSIKPYEVK